MEKLREHLEPRYRLSMQEFLALMDKPGVLIRAKALSPQDRDFLFREIAQFQRAEEGSRIRPDLLPNGNGYVTGKATSPGNLVSAPGAEFGFPTPFAPRDTHRPDRDEKTLAVMRKQVQRLDDELATVELQSQMGTDADRPLDPPTLRDQLEAAASAVSEGSP